MAREAAAFGKQGTLLKWNIKKNFLFSLNLNAASNESFPFCYFKQDIVFKNKEAQQEKTPQKYNKNATSWEFEYLQW